MAPGANLILLQALEEKGSGSSNDIQQALDWVARNASMYNIAAVNMSLGADSNDNTHVVTPYGDEFAALSRIGIVVLVAAGNSYEDYQAEGVGSPASDPGALAVSASNNSKSVLASFSQRSGGSPTSSRRDKGSSVQTPAVTCCRSVAPAWLRRSPVAPWRWRKNSRYRRWAAA